MESRNPQSRNSYLTSRDEFFRMKIKCRPEDFVVEELPEIELISHGSLRLYRLEKTGLGTPEVVDLIRRRWNLAASQVKFGGLKDRHARTIQYLTILNGPDRTLAETSFRVEPLGKVAKPYGPGSFRGNRFSLVIRDLKPDEAESHQSQLASLGREGWPNYFDDQRFGSVSRDGRFIAGAWLQGDHEQALRLALAEPNAMDRPNVKREKAILRECWGDWNQAKARLPRSNSRSIVTYLTDHPSDHKGAFARLNRDMRSLWFSAFQSHLWNLLLARKIESLTEPHQRADYAFKTARLPIYQDLEPHQVQDLTGLELPLPSARNPRPEGTLAACVEEVLAPYSLSWEDLRVRGLKDVYLSKGSRAAIIVPQSFQTRVFADELYPGRHALELGFELPRGAYATLLVKRLTKAR